MTNEVIANTERNPWSFKEWASAMGWYVYRVKELSGTRLEVTMSGPYYAAVVHVQRMDIAESCNEAFQMCD